MVLSIVTLKIHTYSREAKVVAKGRLDKTNVGLGQLDVPIKIGLILI